MKVQELSQDDRFEMFARGKDYSDLQDILTWGESHLDAEMDAAGIPRKIFYVTLFWDEKRNQYTYY